MSCTQLAIIDNHRLFRTLLKDTLQQDERVEIIYCSGSGIDFLKHYPVLKPAISIVSMGLADITCPELAKRVASCTYACPIIGMNHTNGIEENQTAQEAGIINIINATDGLSDLFDAIDYIREQPVRAVNCSEESTYTVRPNRRTREHLSSRELTVLRYLADGYTSREIADELHIAEKTVGTHRHRIKTKTGTKNTPELIIHAVRNGLIK